MPVKVTLSKLTMSSMVPSSLWASVRRRPLTKKTASATVVSSVTVKVSVEVAGNIGVGPAMKKLS